MILVDANVLIYASMSSLPRHEPARLWLDARLSGRERVGLPWPSLLAFMRITTNGRLFRPPLAMGVAWGQVREWLGRDVAWIPTPTERHAEILGQMLDAPGVAGNLVHDADLAALAIEHGLELCSADADFARFPGLRWSNPLCA